MHIATRQGDLSSTASMSEEGDRPSEHEHVGTFTPSLNPQEGIREVKKSAFEITHVQVDNETEDLETSQLHNKTIGEDDNPCSPLSSDMLAASTPSKLVSSSNKDLTQSATALPGAASIAVMTSVNGPPHLHGSRFRKVNDYVRERWKVLDSLEVDADEYSDISEPRSVIHKTVDNASNSSSPSTPRRNPSQEIASSSNLSDGRSDVQLDEPPRNEGATLNEAPSAGTSRRGSTELSQDDMVSDDNYETYSQGTPSETNNVKVNSESTVNVEIPTSSIIRGNVETIKAEASKIIEALKNIESLEAIRNENNRLKKENEKLKKENERLQADIKQLRNPVHVTQQTSSSAVQS